MNNTLITTSLTCLALIAFAANSVLCRLALGNQTIDASSFTIVRLFSGAITLWLITKLSNKRSSATVKGSWTASALLFIYAISFSYAYIILDTGTGALILFGSVQLTIISISLISGTHLSLAEWLGITIAFGGFIYLIMPGVTTPPLPGFLLMSLSGIAWGAYTLKGKNSQNPLLETSFNFSRTLPFLIILSFLTYPYFNFSTTGLTLAIISGSITSGIGYTIWYTALKNLSSVQAAIVQLTVPIIASLGGIIFISETISFRLIISSSLILGGILLVILGKNWFSKPEQGSKT